MDSDDDNSINDDGNSDDEFEFDEEAEQEAMDIQLMHEIGFHPHEEYERLLQELPDDDEGTSEVEFIEIVYKETFQRILEGVDAICDALSNVTHVDRLDLGSGLKLFGAEKLETTEETQEAWNKLLRALGNIETIDNLVLGGYILSGELMAQMLNALQNVQETVTLISVLDTSIGDDMNAFVEALSNHPCPKFKISLANLRGHEPANESSNRFQENGVLSRLFRLQKLCSVSLEEVDLSLNECESLSEALASSAYSTRTLDLHGLAFADGGGRLVAEAFKTNTTLEELTIDGRVFDDASFRAAVTSSLPSNNSIQKLCINHMREASSAFPLLENIGRQNSSITEIAVRQWKHFEITEDEEAQLLACFEQNFSLKSCTINDSNLFAAVTRLNAAGRNYLQQDASSKSRCIDVLGEVKDHLDCLYFHLRENPVLFSGRGDTCSVSGDSTSVRKKRKAAIAGENARRAKKQA